MGRETTGSPESRPAPPRQPDSARRRRTSRKQRERGVSLYITGAELVEAGFNPADDPPYYTVRGYQRSKNGRSVIVSLYREP